jgi:hypothetical protein
MGEVEDDEEEDEEEGEQEGDEDRDAAPRGPRCMDLADFATWGSCPTSVKLFPLTQPEKQRFKIKAGRKKRKREKGWREQAEAASRACESRKVI